MALAPSGIGHQRQPFGLVTPASHIVDDQGFFIPPIYFCTFSFGILSYQRVLLIKPLYDRFRAPLTGAGDLYKLCVISCQLSHCKFSKFNFLFLK
jgi:hypothetical protein